MRRAFLLFLALSLPAAAHPLKPWKGGAAPALQLVDPAGVAHKLADYRGRAVLVNFWATWCEPCREEMPSLEQLQAAMPERLAVLGVNVGEGPRAARRFAEKSGITFTLLLDRDMTTAKSWGAKILPASFIVDAGGKVRYLYYGALDWTSPEVREAIEQLSR